MVDAPSEIQTKHKSDVSPFSYTANV